MALLYHLLQFPVTKVTKLKFVHKYAHTHVVPTFPESVRPLTKLLESDDFFSYTILLKNLAYALLLLFLISCAKLKLDCQLWRGLARRRNRRVERRKLCKQNKYKLQVLPFVAAGRVPRFQEMGWS